MGGGCVSKNPEWLTAPTGAFCARGLNDDCLKDLAEKSYADATAKEVEDRKAAQAPAPVMPDQDRPADADVDSLFNVPELPASPEGVTAPATVPATSKPSELRDLHWPQVKQLLIVPSLIIPPLLAPTLKFDIQIPAKHAEVISTAFSDAHGAGLETNDQAQKKVDDSIPSLAFGIAAIGATAKGAEGYLPSDQVVESKQAGSLLNVGSGPVTDAQIGKVSKIADKALRADTLTGLLSLHSRSMTDVQINGVLNELYSLDRGKYANALIVKLPGLLKVGDLERAKALRGLLLKSPATIDRPFSMLAFVATCYTMAGMKQDSGDIVREAIRNGVELSADDQKLVSLSITIANGSYPMMQEFYDFESDNARLSAYLTIAVVARQLDMPGVARHAIADAVKFIQKTAVKVDRQKALSQILSVTPGIM
uniref:Uncharacterized protein n=2 Tax=Pseudomonas fluorescens TaxID=294 RepID=A0A0G4E4X9_PSEFS|nr:hypothetical protein PQBR57_0039 [Pseudomonas fluorescens SBW25]